MADKLMYIPNDDTQNTPAPLAEWNTNILGMSSRQVRSTLATSKKFGYIYKTLGTSIKLWVTV